jgi:hypothetical protein
MSLIIGRKPTADRLPRALLLLSLLLLGGCLLASGEQQLIDRQGDAVALQLSFVGAEGASVRTLDVGSPDSEVQVIALLGVTSGDLSFELLQPDQRVVFVLTARPDSEVTRSARVLTDSAGLLHYRVRAAGARDGVLQLFVQP